MADSAAAAAPAARTAPSTRSILLWSVAILFANQLASGLSAMSGGAGETGVLYETTDALEIGFFQYLAWFAAFRLAWTVDRRLPASTAATALALALGLSALLPGTAPLWTLATLLGAHLQRTQRRDESLRAAATVTIALAVHHFWGKLLFDVSAFALLRLETAVVGTALQATQSGFSWTGNLISGPGGHAVAIYSGCSSFHNLSLALLGWVALLALSGRAWRPSDALRGLLVGGLMLLLNSGRIYLMASSPFGYGFWHDGPGAVIFAVVSSIAVLAACAVAAGGRARPA